MPVGAIVALARKKMRRRAKTARADAPAAFGHQRCTLRRRGLRGIRATIPPSIMQMDESGLQRKVDSERDGRGMLDSINLGFR